MARNALLAALGLAMVVGTPFVAFEDVLECEREDVGQWSCIDASHTWLGSERYAVPLSPSNRFAVDWRESQWALTFFSELGTGSDALSFKHQPIRRWTRAGAEQDLVDFQQFAAGAGPDHLRWSSGFSVWWMVGGLGVVFLAGAVHGTVRGVVAGS